MNGNKKLYEFRQIQDHTKTICFNSSNLKDAWQSINHTVKFPQDWQLYQITIIQGIFKATLTKTNKPRIALRITE